jgi:transposase-like protein
MTKSLYTWRRQDRMDKGLLPGLSSQEHDEPLAARRRIIQLETELAVTRRAAELLKQAALLSTIRGHPGSGRPRVPVQACCRMLEV